MRSVSGSSSFNNTHNKNITYATIEIWQEALMPRDERMTLRESRVPITFQYFQRSSLTVSRRGVIPCTNPVAKSHGENRGIERHRLIRARRSLVDGVAAEGMPVRDARGMEWVFRTI